ncbi:MAG: GNAT family N-acetyltransferase [Shimia sp.]
MAELRSLQTRVRLLRRARAHTQQDLGDLVGVSRQTINAIENGRYDPGLRLAFDIAAVFAARVEDVFRFSDDTESIWSLPMMIIPDAVSAGEVVLRPHRPSDLPAFERFLLDPDSTRFMAFTPKQKTPEGASAMMDAVIGSYAGEAPICSLTIADAHTDRYLGAVGGAVAGGEEMEVFVTLLPEARGGGRARGAVRALAGHLFETSGTSRLIADIVDENAAAIRLFQNLGFRRERRVDRASDVGALGHTDMSGTRYVLTRAHHRKDAVE